jgi:hypothetical protein
MDELARQVHRYPVGYTRLRAVGSGVLSLFSIWPQEEELA